MDKTTLNEIQNSLNFQIQFYAKIFHDDAVNNFNARIFGTEKEFIKYAKDKANYNPRKMHSIAFYDPVLKEMIMHKDIEDFSKTFTHELSHAILHYYCVETRSWLNEGLAELFEDIIFLDSTYYFDMTQLTKMKEAKTFLSEGASINEPVLSEDFYAYPSHKNYTLSWALIYYLFKVNSEKLAAMIRGSCTEGNDTIRLNYPGGLVLLQIDIKSFYLNFRPKQE